MALHQDLVFAELTEASIGPLRLLNASIFPLPYDEKFYRDLLKQKELSRLVWCKNELIGAICCHLESGKEKKLYISVLGVLAPYRGSGIGTKLVELAMELAENTGTHCVYLHVQVSNEDAIDFYVSRGFHISHTIPNYYKRIEPRDCHVLQKAVLPKVATCP